MYCQLYDLPAEGETTKRAANATCIYFNGGTYIRQPGDEGRHRNVCPAKARNRVDQWLPVAKRAGRAGAKTCPDGQSSSFIRAGRLTRCP